MLSPTVVQSCGTAAVFWLVHVAADLIGLRQLQLYQLTEECSQILNKLQFGFTLVFFNLSFIISPCSEVTFFPPRFRCHCTEAQYGCSENGDALMLYTADDRQLMGNYCDSPSSTPRHSICEAAI